MLPLKERVYRHIRDQMLTGAIKPGQSVSETMLAKGIGVSRTPVREALVRLETLGLIEQSPGIGTRVREPMRREIEEFFELREVLECGAVRLAAQWINAHELAELDALVQQYRSVASRFKQFVTPAETEELASRANILDMSFHLKVMTASKNHRMVQMVADVHLLTRILRRNANLPSDSALRRMSRVLLHHHRIVRALESHDADRAVQATQAHIRWSMQGHLAAFDWHAREGAAKASQDGMFFPQNVIDVLGQIESNVVRDKPMPRKPRE